VKELVRYSVVDGGGGTPIEEEGGCGESLSPIGRWHGRMEEHGADGVVGGAEHAFSLAVLWGGIGAGEAEHNAMAGEERVGGVVNKLGLIICLKGFRCGAKLCLSVGNELDNVAVHLGFLAKRKGPAVMRKIIY